MVSRWAGVSLYVYDKGGHRLTIVYANHLQVIVILLYMYILDVL